VASVTGPLKLAALLLRKDSEEAGTPPRFLVEFAAEAASEVVRDFLEAGADIVLLKDSFPGGLTAADACDWYASLLLPISNTIRFYEALPVLQSPAFSHGRWGEVLQRDSGCIPCPLLGEGQEISAQWRQWNQLGLAAPTRVFEDGLSAEWSGRLDGLLHERKLALLTSADDLAGIRNVNHLRDTLKSFQEAFASVD
jgi:hypothetical protein